MATQKDNFVFAGRVKEELQACGITQKKLCEDLHITEGSFSRYMQEGRIPRSDILADIACYLNTTSDYLLGRDENVQNAFKLFAKNTKSTSSKESRELAEILNGINKSIGY